MKRPTDTDPFIPEPPKYEDFIKSWNETFTTIGRIIPHMVMSGDPKSIKKERILHVLKALKTDMDMLENLVTEL